MLHPHQACFQALRALQVPSHHSSCPQTGICNWETVCLAADRELFQIGGPYQALESGWKLCYLLRVCSDLEEVMSDTSMHVYKHISRIVSVCSLFFIIYGAR